MSLVDSRPTQLSLPIPDLGVISKTLPFTHVEFSHNNVCDHTERQRLEKRYEFLFEEDQRFNRKIVSFQANKGELIHGWIHYKEGFSSRLVETLIQEFHIKPGDYILDPFAGSATTLLVAKTLGINAIGIEILPNCHLAWEAKSRFADYDVNELRSILDLLLTSEPFDTGCRFPHIPITDGAFTPNVERDIMFYTYWIEQIDLSHNANVLLKLIINSILEAVSFTRKDGQYLRWDYRSEKVRKTNDSRERRGKPPVKKIDKGRLPTVKDILIKAMKEVMDDVFTLQGHFKQGDSVQEMIKGNTLEVLPTLAENHFDGVITSPPYANRYDYTRTYALELAYLGIHEISKLRQDLLSCTVESRSKVDYLRDYYDSIGQSKRYKAILQVARGNSALLEINRALEIRWQHGDMNNKGVLRMIEQYFQELTFVFAELQRITKPGAHVAFVNDNVRYGGEIIPVDTITTNLAESLGFEPIKIYVLAQKKGNSSQQMRRFGRVELRKCITIWRKS